MPMFNRSIDKELKAIDEKLDFLLGAIQKQAELNLTAHAALLDFLAAGTDAVSASPSSLSDNTHSSDNPDVAEMQKTADAAMARAREVENELDATPIENEGLIARNAKLLDQIDKLNSELAALKATERQAREEKERLEISNRELECQLAESRKAPKFSPPKAEALRGLQDFLEAVSLPVRQILTPYFNIDELDVFLIQCGQFNRVNQLWEACGKAVAAGAPAGEFGRLLRQVLALYNSASADSPALPIEADIGEAYKNEVHFRVKSDGSRVAELLLPGLRNPGGRVSQPALVRLR